MECVKCAKPIEDDSVYCRFCGKKQVTERRHKKRANNTGNIYKRPGNLQSPWVVRKNGVYIGAYKSRTEAQKALERLTDVDVNEKYNMTFAQVYERWKAEKSREISANTMRDYQVACSHCEQLHNQQIRKILRSDYQKAIIALEEKGMSKSSCNKLRVVFSQVCKWAMDEGILQNNPAAELTTTAEQKSVRQVFSPDQIAAIKKSKNPAADIALILISCGCRPGELFTAPLVNCREDHIIWGSKTEAGKNRVIPIGPDGRDAYARMREAAIATKKDNLIDGYRGNNKTLLNYRKREWKELMEEIGAEDMTPYCCRHTFITNAIIGGMDLPKLEAIVGHVDRETTKIYTHLRASDLVIAVQQVSTEKNAVCNILATHPNSSKRTTQKSS